MKKDQPEGTIRLNFSLAKNRTVQKIVQPSTWRFEKKRETLHWTPRERGSSDHGSNTEVYVGRDLYFRSGANKPINIDLIYHPIDPIDFIALRLRRLTYNSGLMDKYDVPYLAVDKVSFLKPICFRNKLSGSVPSSIKKTPRPCPPIEWRLIYSPSRWVARMNLHLLLDATIPT